ncbi:MAG: glycosyltransferase [Parcubacteria group bacterium]|nr:glycosyltransferase [Parcubacteria group bacterium]
MRVLMFSTDSSILVPGSDSRERMRAYSAIVERLHVIVLNRNKEKRTSVAKHGEDIFRVRIGRRLVLYPTRSFTNASALFGAFKIGNKVLPLKNDPFRKQWLITAQNPFALGILGWLLSKLHGVALELQLHTDTESPFFKKESLRNAVRAVTARCLLPRADGVRVVSERLAKPLRVRAGKIPEIMPVFVDIGALRSQPLVTDIKKKYPQFDFLILTVSRLSREKDIGTALRALAEIVKKHPKTGLIIVGDGPERAKLELMTTDYGLLTNVMFEGWQNDLVSYYRSVDAYLLTSRYEGYGRTLIEAASLGCPIVSSDVGIIGEVFKHNENALICPIGDTACFARELTRLREDEHSRRALSVRAEQAVNGIEMSREDYLKNCNRMWRECVQAKK